MLEFLFLLATVGVIVWIWRSRSAVTDDENICANCGYDLRASTGRCPECGTPFTRTGDRVPLRDDWPADPISPRAPGSDESQVVVHITDSELEAKLLRDQLEYRGIAAQLQLPAPATGPEVYGVPLGRPAGSWRVIVWSADADLALAIREKLIPRAPAPVE